MTLNYDLTGFPGATSPPIPPIPPAAPNLVRQQTTSTRQQGNILAASHAHTTQSGIAHSGHGAAHRPVQPKKRVVAHHRPNPFGEKAF
jgi:hypothetical protein